MKIYDIILHPPLGSKFVTLMKAVDFTADGTLDYDALRPEERDKK